MISFQKNVSSNFFQYSERNINSTETTDTSFFGAEKFEGVAVPGGLHAHLQQKDIEKKSKFDGANSGSKKKN